MDIAVVFLVLACLIFAFGAWSRWWPVPAAQYPYYPAFICMGLFFWALAQLWPLLRK